MICDDGPVVPDQDGQTGGAVSVAISEADGKYGEYHATAISDADAIAIGGGSTAFASAISESNLEFKSPGEGGPLVDDSLYAAGTAESDALAIAAFGGTANALSFTNAEAINSEATGTDFKQAVDFGPGGAAWAWGYSDATENIAIGGAVSISISPLTQSDSLSGVVADAVNVQVEANVSQLTP
jgi:hypothetical protein